MNHCNLCKIPFLLNPASRNPYFCSSCFAAMEIRDDNFRLRDRECEDCSDLITEEIAELNEGMCNGCYKDFLEAIIEADEADEEDDLDDEDITDLDDDEWEDDDEDLDEDYNDCD